MIEALSYPFFQNALLAGLLASVATGVIGSFVVVKRISSLSGGLSHAAFGGVGLGYLIGISPMLGALGFGLLAALIISAVYLHRQGSLDSLISMVWSVGMALGVVFIAMTPGYVPDLSGYLFGNILFVPRQFLLYALLVDLLVCLCVFLLFNRLELVCFDEEFANVVGVRAGLIFTALLLLVALVVVTLIRVVGVILTIALLTTPAVIARQWSDDLGRMMALAVGISGFCVVGGLFLSYWLAAAHAWNIPTGPLIILIATLVFGVSAIVHKRCHTS